MGRLFVEFFSSPCRVCVCSQCGIQIASMDYMRWSGIMGHEQPARNYGKEGVINVSLGDAYDKLLTSGGYVLRTVSCNRCATYLGWKYVTAQEGNKDREGTFMLMDNPLAGPFSD
eukprot:NODE_884_length_1259_cov_311.093388_g675_i0.p3 GENE.NODE_884_length_1259_cov_311.093388_g675_i0~~NODE_884_length_1259_cov_311.093388_g675_i0.p3  ORF type:complete len:115 (-),score=14.98 NODE_884_length_1259_cov_311.093388_g675_i0:834-1178(-)